jgi:hypothetical protein
LGVRLGFYLQLASNVLLVKRRPEEAISSIVLTNMFMSGFFIAQLYSVTHNHYPRGAIVPMMNFLILDISDPFSRLLYYKTTTITAISFWTLAVFGLRWSAYVGFSTWLWFRGINADSREQCMEPGVFLFANLGAYGGIRTASKVGCVGGIFACVIGISWLIAIFLKRCQLVCDSWDERWAFKKEEDNDQPREEWADVLIAMAWAFPSLVILAIVAIELTIRWNNLSGVRGITSTGQLIPFVIGCFSIFRSLVLFII